MNRSPVPSVRSGSMGAMRARLCDVLLVLRRHGRLLRYARRRVIGVPITRDAWWPPYIPNALS